MNKLLSILILILILIPSISEAQVTHITLPFQPTNRLVWSHDGKDTNGNNIIITGFRLVIDGVSKDLGLVPLGTGNSGEGYGIPFPVLTVGNHIIVIFVRTADQESGPSAEAQFVVEAAPIINYAPRPPTDVKFIP